MLTYNAETAEADLSQATKLLTGSFRETYIQLTRDTVIPGAQQNHISAKATVPDAGVTSADGSSATVLLFVNQSTTAGTKEPTMTQSSVRVHLVKVEGRWLIDAFDPV